jgi:AcrR family transcriptional regulator
MLESSSAPRPYHSPLRAERATQTRARILDAAADEFASRGVAGSTLARIAAAAEVSVERVRAEGGKSALLLAAFERRFGGEDGRHPLAERREFLAARDASDDVFLDAFLEAVRRSNARGAALWRVFAAAAHTEPEVREVYDGLIARRRVDFRTLVDAFDERGMVASGADRDRLASGLAHLLSIEGYEQLVIVDGWDPDAYVAWLRDVIHRLLHAD